MVIKRNFKSLPRSHLYWFPIIYTIELLRNVSLTDVNFLFSDENECYILKPCQHDGICINNNGSYVCNCSKGWQGHDCEEGQSNVQFIFRHCYVSNWPCNSFNIVGWNTCLLFQMLMNVKCLSLVIIMHRVSITMDPTNVTA